MVSELLSNLNRYLIGQSSLRDLEAWLLGSLQHLLDSGDARVIEAANHLDADLVQLGEGVIDEVTLRGRLEGWFHQLETISVRFPEVPAFSVAGISASNAIYRREGDRIIYAQAWGRDTRAGAHDETLREPATNLVVVDLRLDHSFV